MKTNKQGRIHEQTRGECYDTTHAVSIIVHLDNATIITPDVWIMEFPAYAYDT